MIKTINLTGFEVKVTELGGDNTEIFNNGGDTVYASKLPDITVGGDNVIAVPTGAIDGLYGTHGTVYLLGTGSVELRGVDHKITKARGQSASGGGGTGVSTDYVDAKCVETLENANAYADVKDSEVVLSAKEYADDKDADTLNSAKKYADSLNADLAGYIGYTDNDIYGLEADFENCIFTRLAGAVGKNPGADFDSVNAYGGRRRCNLSDSGEVLAYYGDENFKADGSNGQVMVEQHKFYYRVVPIKTEKIGDANGYHLRKARYYISDTPKAGFKVHPAFVRNGIEVDRLYLSAFEGCIYNTSADKYLSEGEQITDFNSDKLSSIAGAKPYSGYTRSNARNLAHNRGIGWEQSTIQAISATQLLFIIEYANFHSQKTIGAGAVNKAAGYSNMAEQTGATLSLGNHTGTAVNGNGVQFVSYRGEENLWGNIWAYVDGANIMLTENGAARMYVSDNNFVDNLSSAPYTDTLISPCSNNGFVSGFGYSTAFDWMFVPSEAVGSSTLPIGDFCWGIENNGTNWKNFIWGGAWYDGTHSGCFCIGLNSASSSNWRSFGARLQYFPN